MTAIIILYWTAAIKRELKASHLKVYHVKDQEILKFPNCAYLQAQHTEFLNCITYYLKCNKSWGKMEIFLMYIGEDGQRSLVNTL